MKRLRHEIYQSSSWCSGCKEMLKPGDDVWRDHERHHIYCAKCAKEADHRIAIDVWQMRRKEVIKALERLHGEDSSIPFTCAIYRYDIVPNDESVLVNEYWVEDFLCH